MNIFKIGLLNLLTVLTLVLPWSAIEAEEYYDVIGQINKLDISTITVNNKSYRMNPVVEVGIPGKKNARLKDFKKGDSVWLRTIIIDGIHYVISIKLITLPPA